MTEQRTSFPWRLIIYGIIGIVILVRFLGGSGSDSSSTDYIEETLETPTQGIWVELQEMKQDEFKITNEEILDAREDSRIIATYMDNTVDTFTIDEVTLTEESSPRRSMIRSIAYAGMIGYMMGRPMSSGINRSAYASESAYNKSNTAGRSQLRSTAKRTTTRKPTSSKSYGSGKSTKSYGG